LGIPPRVAINATWYEKPEDGACYFSAEIRSDEYHSLVVARVEHNFAQVLDFKKFTEPADCAAAAAVTVKILLIYIDNLRLVEARNVGGIFQCLPGNIAAAIIQLVLNDDEIAVLVERKEVQAFAGFIEPIKLFLDNEELIAKGVRLVCQPFLKVVPFTQLEVRKAFLDEARKTVLGKLDAEHYYPLQIVACLKFFAQAAGFIEQEFPMERVSF